MKASKDRNRGGGQKNISALSCFGLTAGLMTKILIILVNKTEDSFNDSHGSPGNVLRIVCLPGARVMNRGPNIGGVWRVYAIAT
jgi:hypothetical protein